MRQIFNKWLDWHWSWKGFSTLITFNSFNFKAVEKGTLKNKFSYSSPSWKWLFICLIITSALIALNKKPSPTLNNDWTFLIWIVYFLWKFFSLDFWKTLEINCEGLLLWKNQCQLFQRKARLFQWTNGWSKASTKILNQNPKEPLYENHITDFSS